MKKLSLFVYLTCVFSMYAFAGHCLSDNHLSREAVKPDTAHVLSSNYLALSQKPKPHKVSDTDARRRCK